MDWSYGEEQANLQKAQTSSTKESQERLAKPVLQAVCLKIVLSPVQDRLVLP